MTHGTRSCYVAGCRQPECRAASNAYARDLGRQRRRERYGIQPQRHRMSEAKWVQRHIAYLQAHGATQQSIARAAGVARSSVTLIAQGRYRRVRTTTADRILAVPLSKVVAA